MCWFSTLALLSFATVVYAVVGPGVVTGNTAVHDPTMCKDNSGKYFVFSTAVGIEIRTSNDRTAWTLVGKVWPDGAPWTDPFTNTSNGGLWSPDCTYINGQFILYYAASTFGSQKSAIFLAKSSTGLPGSWTNEGMVASTTSGDIHNDIDPNLLLDDEGWFLSLGNAWTGIKSTIVNPSTGLLISPSSLTPVAQRGNNGAIGASIVFKLGDLYYLFTSWDRCCNGTSSTSNIRVGRSSSANGSFVDHTGTSLLDGGGTLVLGAHDGIFGPGGQDVMMDNDQPLLIYHYYTVSGEFLGINNLDFSSGWPVVV